MPLTLPFTSICRSAEETQSIGCRLGQSLHQGIAIQLYGDLGSGKTCFVQGLALGLQVPRGYDITSPTYTLINSYPGRLPLHHVDLYRLDQGIDAETLGLEEMFAYNTVVAVEWPQRLPANQWPPSCLTVEIIVQPDDSRMIRISPVDLKKTI